MSSRLVAAALMLSSSLAVVPGAIGQVKDVDISTQVDSGIAQITYATQYGKFIVRLPDEMAANDTYWGTAVLEPIGDDNSYSKGANYVALKKLHAEVKPVNGKAITIAPGTKPTPGKIPAGCEEVLVSLCDPNNKLMHTVRRPCSSKPLAGYPDNKVAMPQVAQPKHNFRAGANNSGNPGAMLARAGSQFLPPIAGNNRNQWYRMPEDMKPGRTPLEVYFPESGMMARSQLNVVQPKIYGPKLMHIGDTGQGRISLAGMGNLKGGSVIFRNLTPDVTRVEGGDYQVFPIK